MKYGRIVSRQITMYKKQHDKVRRLADEKHEGNYSRALREMVDAFDDGTKEKRPTNAAD